MSTFKSVEIFCSWSEYELQIQKPLTPAFLPMSYDFTLDIMWKYNTIHNWSQIHSLSCMHYRTIQCNTGLGQLLKNTVYNHVSVPSSLFHTPPCRNSMSHKSSSDAKSALQQPKHCKHYYLIKNKGT